MEKEENTLAGVVRDGSREKKDKLGLEGRIHIIGISDPSITVPVTLNSPF